MNGKGYNDNWRHWNENDSGLDFEGLKRQKVEKKEGKRTNE